MSIFTVVITMTICFSCFLSLFVFFLYVLCFFFFFSSRRRHTRWNCDWSSDVCSSDLPRLGSGVAHRRMLLTVGDRPSRRQLERLSRVLDGDDPTGEIGAAWGCKTCSRSEERRVGKECRSRRSPYH